ncbi:monovalent cation/H+ antiporter complex subunit F [Streptomyces decoyicus]|uniref:monovalent cation/H+ antiporter complex subunit F n=1 Tax=Streptomyces decoyicus TaxID=249567 RepID=UPI002E1746AB|nr:monovalent cation/H+ antiporter complex subunit F [Streptomyces decoyicus]WSV50437.1 monovalent cation/H+ antiporter complex subunit F [Streptomyces decoyicus]
MNGWTAAGTALLLCGVVPAAYGAATGPVRRRVPAQNLVTTLLSLVVLLLAQGYRRPAYVDPALVLAVLGPAGTLLYVRLLADRLADRPPRPRSLLTVTALTYVAVPAVVLPLCVAAGPGRALVKLLVIGVLLLMGSRVAARAVTAAVSTGHGRTGPAAGMSDG